MSELDDDPEVPTPPEIKPEGHGRAECTPLTHVPAARDRPASAEAFGAGSYVGEWCSNSTSPIWWCPMMLRPTMTFRRRVGA